MAKKSIKRRPLNKQTIVVYSDGGYSHLFRKYVSLWDIRDSCDAGDSCSNSDEHWTFDGQFFFKNK